MRRITRKQAIHDIRGELLKLVDDDHSMCEVAARLVFCGGFAHWTFGELKKIYPQIVRSRSGWPSQPGESSRVLQRAPTCEVSCGSS